jgi:chemotaxis protein methyltransferase CheR
VPVGFTVKDSAYIRNLVRERSAIILDEDKDYLVHSRLEPLAKDLGFDSLPELVKKLRYTSNDELHKDVVEAMTTNETSFFRDFHPFLALKEHLLPDLIARNTSRKTLSIWCGASSSGQEPYSIMLTILEHFPDLKHWQVQFVATDISRKMVKRCREGKYSQLEVNRGIPASLLTKYFVKIGTHWQIAEDVRKRIEFREMNLAGPWKLYSKMDLVVLRNVMIYFDEDTKKHILKKIRGILDPRGYLLLGGSETTINLDKEYERIPLYGTSCYRIRKD